MERHRSVILDTNGNALNSVTVTIRRQADNSLASIFSDDLGTPTVKGNPFHSGPPENLGPGEIFFYAPNGRYKIVLSGAVNETREDILLHDPGESRLPGTPFTGDKYKALTVNSGESAYERTRVPIWVADIAARDALAAPYTGLTVLVNSTGVLYRWDGAAWAAILTKEIADAGAAAGPIWDMYKSGTRTANDLIGAFAASFDNTTPAKVQFLALLAKVLDATAASEDAEAHLRSIVAGVEASQLIAGDGVYTPGATGGAPGADIINASGFQKDGNILVERFVSTGQSITGNSTHTFAHGLGAEPDVVTVIIQCTTADVNYSIGDRVIVPDAAEVGSVTDFNATVEIDGTNVSVHVGDDIQIHDKTGFEINSITKANWDLYVKALTFAA